MATRITIVFLNLNEVIIISLGIDRLELNEMRRERAESSNQEMTQCLEIGGIRVENVCGRTRTYIPRYIIRRKYSNYITGDALDL